MPTPPSAQTGREVRPAVLIAHRYFWPENISEMPLILRTVAEFHLARGDAVTVAAGSSADFRREWDEAFGARVRIERFIAPSERGQPIWRRALGLIRLCWLVTRMLARGRYSLVYTVSYPPLAAFWITLVSTLMRGGPAVIYYVQDIFSYRIGFAPLRWLYHRMSGWTVRHAGIVITLSEAMKRQLIAHAGPGAGPGCEQRIAVIPNFCALGETPGDERPRRLDVIYAGNHGEAQNLELFLAALAAMAPCDRPTVAFFGEGSAKPRLVALASELGLGERITFHAPVSRERIARELAAARFGLVGAVPGLMDYAFPSKLGNYASAGAASLVMCEEDGETGRWLAETGLGHAIDPLDPQTAAAQLTAIFARGARHEPDPAAIIAAARQHFGREDYLRRLAAALEPFRS